MDVHPGTNLNSLEHVEDHCRELHPNGVLGNPALPWLSDVLCAMTHMRSLHIGVCCVHYVASRCRVRA